MSRLFLLRELYKEKDPNALHGIMLLDGEFFCFTMENYVKKIPSGIYDCEIYNSPRHHMEVILLKDVPNRSMIEIHIANFPKELEGCIAPGEFRGQGMVMNSKVTFDKLMQTVDRNDIKIMIEDLNDPPSDI